MALNFGSDVIPETLDKQGYDNAGQGSYHFEVTAIDEGGGEAPLVLDLVVLAGEPLSEVGKTHREYLSKPNSEQTPENRESTASRFFLLAVATGIATEEEVKAARESGKGLNLDFDLAIGRQLCGKLSNKTYEGKTRAKLGFDLWPINSEKAKGILLNEKRLAEQGTVSAEAAADPLAGF